MNPGWSLNFPPLEARFVSFYFPLCCLLHTGISAFCVYECVSVSDSSLFVRSAATAGQEVSEGVFLSFSFSRFNTSRGADFPLRLHLRRIAGLLKQRGEKEERRREIVVVVCVCGLFFFGHLLCKAAAAS